MRSAADRHRGRAPRSTSDAGDQTWARGAGLVGTTAVGLVLELALWGFDPTVRGGGRVPTVVVVAAVVAVFVVLLWRRRRPLLVFAVVWAYSVGLGVLLPTFQPFTAMVVALYAATRRTSVGQAIALLAAASVLVPLNTVDTMTALDQEPAQTAVTAGIWVMIFGLTYAWARVNQRSEKDAERALTYLAGEAALAAQTERLRIARDVHDVISHSVTAIILNAAAARRRQRPDQELLTRALQMTEEVGTQAMAELRTLLGLLRDDVSETRTGRGLADVDLLVGTIRACGVDVRVVREGLARPLPPSVDGAGYRVVQEMLTNVAKHGGAHAKAVLAVCWTGDRVDLVVDNTVGLHGPGAEPLPSGFGLDGVRRRVEEVGGELTTSRPSARTFRCAARLPAPVGLGRRP